jgi:hypothetical protein
MPNLDKIDANDVVVQFKDEQGKIKEVSVSDLMNDMFNSLFKLESRIEELEKSKKKSDSPIITLDQA